jgi:predicted RNA polymerase sigma factor
MTYLAVITGHSLNSQAVDGPEVGLEVIAALAADKRMAQHHRLLAARAHLRERAGDTEMAAADYLAAAPRDQPARALLSDR